MKELKGDHDTLGQIYMFLTLKVFPILVIACAVVLAIVYLYISFAWGWLYVVLFFAILIITRWSLERLIARPDLKIFKARPWLFGVARNFAIGMGITHRALGTLHAEHGRFVLWTAGRWKQLSPKAKVGVILGTLITLIPISSVLVVTTVNEVGKTLPYGKKRFAMSAEELAIRKRNRIEQAKFAVWGKQGAVADAKCMEQYRNLLYAEADKNSISSKRFEGQMFVESACKTDLVNTRSGAAGFAQIMLDVACERGMILDKQFCKEVLASSGKTKIRFIPKNRNIEDRRVNPNYAIPAAADILGDNARYWGNEDWAFVQYHMGQGNLRNLVIDYLDETSNGWRKKYAGTNFENLYSSDPERVLPKAIKESGFSYDDIFFRVTPDKTPKSYSRLFSLKDSSGWYVYTGLAAAEGFELMRNNYASFLTLVKAVQDPDGGTANRPMRAWWSDKDAKYKTRLDIALAASKGELVRVPNNSSYGFVLRTTGADRIGECDPGHEPAYYYTRKATAGLIYLIGNRIKEFESAQAFEVTGLIRSNDMYDKPRSNGKACLPNTNPRTHVIGSAFDIGFNINGKPKSKTTKQAIEFTIMDLMVDGWIDRIPEGYADHISYNPMFEKQLEQVYDEVMAGRSPLIAKR